MRWLTDPVVRMLVGRVVRALLAAAIGLLVDAGLLDRAVSDALLGALSVLS